MVSQSRKEVIHQSLELLHQPGNVFEIRALKMGRVKTASGYFDNFEAAAEAALACDARGAAGVYVTLNPCDPALLARAANRIVDWPAATTTDHEIAARQWLFIDIDPVRPTGIAATQEERKAANELAHGIEEILRGRGWPFPLIADSGNGAYLLFRVDLPNDDASKDLVKQFYSGLSSQLTAVGHDQLGAKIDATVFNAARIIRIGGTINRKGDNTSDRPHRAAAYHPPIEECPVTCVSPDQILDISRLAGKSQTTQSTGATLVMPGDYFPARSWLDVPRYLTDRGLPFTTKPVGDGIAFLVTCPFDSNHGARGESALIQSHTGKLTYHCKHNSCSHRHWYDFRNTIGNPDPEHWSNTSPAQLTDGQIRPQSVPTDFTKLIDSKTLLELDLRSNFLIRNVLVAEQPMIIGARAKGMKTSIATDLVVSLGSGTDFLGKFPTQRCRVAFWSGESGASTIRDTAMRVAQARGIDLADTSIQWNFQLPKVCNGEHLYELAKLIDQHSLDVIVLDPLYLSLLSLETAHLAGNLYAMGAALAPLSRLGQRTGATIIVLHHFRKSGAPDPNEPAPLDELAQSGIAEWARQWILLQRREPYQGDGFHKLWMRCGGSAGHAGLYPVDIEEGIFDPDQLNSRRWNVSVREGHDVRLEMGREKEQRKVRQVELQKGDDTRKLLEAIRSNPRETKSALRELVGLNSARLSTALDILLKDKHIQMVSVQKHTRPETGYEAIST